MLAEDVPNSDTSFATDGKSVLYATRINDQSFEIRRLPLEGDRKPVTLYRSNDGLSDVQASPDGRYYSFVQKASGRDEVFLAPISGGDTKWQVSNSGGFGDHWNKRGDRLYYQHGSTIMEVEVRTQPTLSLGAPVKVLDGNSNYFSLYRLFGYGVAPDGQRFLCVQSLSASQNAPANLTVVQNWFAEFKDKQKK